MGKELFNIIRDMSDVLDTSQLKKLEEVLVYRLSEEERYAQSYTNDEYLDMFLDAKQLEGCSQRTVQCYRFTIIKVLIKLDTPIIIVNDINNFFLHN